MFCRRPSEVHKLPTPERGSKVQTTPERGSKVQKCNAEVKTRKIGAGPQAEERRGVVREVHCMATQRKVQKILKWVGVAIPLLHGPWRTPFWCEGSSV